MTHPVRLPRGRVVAPRLMSPVDCDDYEAAGRDRGGDRPVLAVIDGWGEPLKPSTQGRCPECPDLLVFHNASIGCEVCPCNYGIPASAEGFTRNAVALIEGREVREEGRIRKPGASGRGLHPTRTGAVRGSLAVLGRDLPLAGVHGLPVPGFTGDSGSGGLRPVAEGRVPLVANGRWLRGVTQPSTIDSGLRVGGA
jgi:hypothetical protein